MQFSVSYKLVGVCVLKFATYQIPGIISIAMDDVAMDDVAMETSLVNFILVLCFLPFNTSLVNS